MLVYIILFAFIPSSFEQAMAPMNNSINKVEQFLDMQTFLMDTIFKGYRRELPAIYTRGRYENDSEITYVNVTFMNGKILSIDEPQQTVNMIAETYMIWTDFRLRWDPAQFDGIQMILVNRRLVWIPDILLTNMITAEETSYMDVQQVMLFANGSANMYYTSVFKMMCDLNIRDFPFDVQSCSVAMRSANFFATEVQLYATVYDGLNTDQMGSGEWLVTGITQSADTTRKIGGYVYPIAAFTYRMERSSTYYVVLIIIPSFILTFLCVLGLFWSPITQDTYMEKLNLGFSAILAMVMILQITTDNMPKTAHLPLLSLFILINLLMVTIAIMVVLLTAKYVNSNVYVKQRQMEEDNEKTCRFRRFVIRSMAHIHQIYLLIFSLASIVNLIVLCTLRTQEKAIA